MGRFYLCAKSLVSVCRSSVDGSFKRNKFHGLLLDFKMNAVWHYSYLKRIKIKLDKFFRKINADRKVPVAFLGTRRNIDVSLKIMLRNLRDLLASCTDLYLYVFILLQSIHRKHISFLSHIKRN